MSQHIWQVFTYELKRNIRRKGFLFTTFGIPLLAFIILIGYRTISQANANKPSDEAGENGAAVQSEGPQFDGIKRAGYVDLTGQFSDPGPDLEKTLVRYDDEASAAEALASHQIDAYYVIPADYLETGDVSLIVPKLNLNLATDAPVRHMILNHLASNIDDPNLFKRLLDPGNFNQVNLQRDASGQTKSNFGADFLVVYAFAIALMMSVFLTNGYLMQTVVEEKETRLIEILISTMRPTQLLAGKIFAFGLMGLLQIVVWVGSLFFLAKFVAAGSPALMALSFISLSADKVLILLLYFVFGYLFFAAGYGMVGAISNSMQEGPQFAVIFTLPAVVPLYFLALFITTPDAPLPTILSIIPITAPLAMVMRVTITTVPLWQIVLSLGLLIVVDILMIWLAGRMFRVQTLLAGQTPKLRDIPRLLRG